jgi:ABC-type iron transport system FetAB permease component
MNNKAQLAELGLSIVVALMIFMAGMLFINPLKDSITTFRADMSCSSSATISDGTKAACLVGDATIPYLIISIIAIAGGIITNRLLI